ncbi:S49 family peptidase [Saccharopolyspora erythraea]|uniref:S49 family peptidase n=1 Tax=Saccharopolyspora erythraea TaxID=1836 RepID=UPI001BA5F94B|nr:S49 family peptidase [Saccharopolyspora erythraea]QUG99494.1 S49 family peptidase [Saccharopolyspora erythraea]
MNDKAPQRFTDLLSEKLSAKLPGKLGEKAERGPVVAVVKLHGVITPTPSPVSRSTISAQTTESALTRAFGHDRLSAVVLSINSPGGAPTQSALVADRIRELADEKKVPVLAFCEDVAASGGYWLACAADEIHAHQTSIVGSVGVVSASFGFNGLLERFGVERRVYTAGDHKVRLDPFSPEKQEDVRWLHGLQTELHDQFQQWVRDRRGERLKGTDEELFSGEVYSGAKALELGLVDGVGSLRGIVRRKFPDAHLVTVEPRKPLLAKLGVGSPASARLGGAGAVVEALEHRAMWSRFGL